MQAPQDSMNTDEMMEEQTQQATQSTQHSGSQTAGDASSHLWGFLQPCSTLLKRIDFFKIQPTVSIGRSGEQNEIILPGGKVSAYISLCCSSLRVVPRRIDAFLAGNRHCRIVWDGKEDDKSAVIVADYSSNGTFVGFDAFPYLVTRSLTSHFLRRSMASGSAGTRPRSSKRAMKSLLGPPLPNLEVSRITVCYCLYLCRARLTGNFALP
jgi:hypothetical protein